MRSAGAPTFSVAALAVGGACQSQETIRSRRYRMAYMPPESHRRIVHRLSCTALRGPLFSCALLISDALRRALVKRVTRALEPRDGRGIGVSRADIHELTVLTWLVRVEQAEILVEALVDRRRRRRLANGRKQDEARHQQCPACTRTMWRLYRHSRPRSSPTLRTHDSRWRPCPSSRLFAFRSGQQASSSNANMLTMCGGALFPALIPTPVA